MDNVLMIIGIIFLIMAYAGYEARNDIFYRDLENKKLNVEINKFETLKGIVDMCKSLEIHLKIVRENQKKILDKMSEKSPIVLNNEPRVDFCDKDTPYLETTIAHQKTIINDLKNKCKRLETDLSELRENIEKYPAISPDMSVEEVLRAYYIMLKLYPTDTFDGKRVKEVGVTLTGEGKPFITFITEDKHE